MQIIYPDLKISDFSENEEVQNKIKLNDQNKQIDIEDASNKIVKFQENFDNFKINNSKSIQELYQYVERIRIDVLKQFMDLKEELKGSKF